METQKIFTFALFSILAVFLLAGLASATYTATTTTALSQAADGTVTNGVINVTNTGASAITLNVTDSGDFDVIATPSTLNLGATGSGTESATVTIAPATLPLVLPFGSHTITITFSDAAATPIEQTQTVNLGVISPFCIAGEQGTDLVIKNIDISNEGEGDDNEWQPLDTIKVEVEVDNDGDETVDDVMIRLALFDEDGNDVTSDLDFINSGDEEIDVGNIKDGKDAVETFEFEVPADFTLGDYKLAIKTFSDDLGEALACDDTSNDFDEYDMYNEISVDFDEDNPVVIDEKSIKLSSTSAQPGDRITLTFEVYNVGDTDEDQVRVDLLSVDLGIDTSLEIKNGLDSTDGQKMEYIFTVPSSTKTGTYSIAFAVDYDYDSRNDEYDETSLKTWRASLDVVGAAEEVSEALKVSVAAVLDSEAEAGKEITVKATITNNEATTQTLIVDAKEFSDWAELVSISNRLVTLEAGKSADVVFTLKADKGVSGTQTFTIETLAGTKLAQQSVEVEVTDSSLFSSFGDNSLIWIIGIINVVLILLIIVVAIKLSR